MATYDSRAPPYPHEQRYRASSAGTAPIPVPQPRAYPPPPHGQPSLSTGVRPEDAYLPQPSVPTAPAPSSYQGPPPQVPPGYPSQNYQPQPPQLGTSYPPPQAPGQYFYTSANGGSYPPPSAAQAQGYAPSSYTRRPRNDSQRSSYSGRSDGSPARPQNHPASYQQTWLPTTYESGYPGYDRRSSYDHAPYQTLSHEDPPRRDRRASYAYRREYDDDDRYDIDYSSDSRSSEDRERRKRRANNKSKSHKNYDKQPTLAESTIWAWKGIKDIVKA